MMVQASVHNDKLDKIHVMNKKEGPLNSLLGETIAKRNGICVLKLIRCAFAPPVG